MTEPQSDQQGLRPAAEPTLRVERPPVPGRAVRAEMAAGARATPPIRHDEPTVTITPQGRTDPRRTLEFGIPVRVKVTVGRRQRPRRRHRTWPWIVAVVLALAVLGVLLLVLMLQGASMGGGTDLIGSGSAGSLLVGTAAPAAA